MKPTNFLERMDSLGKRIWVLYYLVFRRWNSVEREYEYGCYVGKTAKENYKFRLEEHEKGGLGENQKSSDWAKNGGWEYIGKLMEYGVINPYHPCLFSECTQQEKDALYTLRKAASSGCLMYKNHKIIEVGGR